MSHNRKQIYDLLVITGPTATGKTTLAVNLAARLCGAAPGGEIWIGSDTYSRAMDWVEVKELGDQTFKGKTESVAVYSVTGWREEVR